MSEDWLEKTAAFYGVSMEEAHQRHQRCIEQGDDPADPICIGCARRPHEISDYILAAQAEEDDALPTGDEVRRYVINEEGTYNRKNGHFFCDECYIRNGMPTSEKGWVCP